MKLICHFSPAFRPRLSRAAASAGELTGKRGVRWIAALGPVALVCAGGLLAIGSSVAAESPAATPPEAAATAPSQPAATSSNDPWWTYVGNSMHIKRTEDGHARDYHSWVDLLGRSHETWRVDGQSAPVDAGVREWVAQHHAAPTPPTPPRPPQPPAESAAPVPALPPPPEMAGDPAFQALVQQLQHDEQALALLGSPIVVDTDCHPCHIENTSSALHLTVHGSKGSALLDAEGVLANGQWRYPVLKLTSA